MVIMKVLISTVMLVVQECTTPPHVHQPSRDTTAREEFYQAFSNVSTASNKHWGEGGPRSSLVPRPSPRTTMTKSKELVPFHTWCVAHQRHGYDEPMHLTRSRHSGDENLCLWTDRHHLLHSLVFLFASTGQDL